MEDNLLKKPRKPLLVRLPVDLTKELRHLAIDRDKSLNALIEEAIVLLLNQHKGSEK